MDDNDIGFYLQVVIENKLFQIQVGIALEQCFEAGARIPFLEPVIFEIIHWYFVINERAGMQPRVWSSN